MNTEFIKGVIVPIITTIDEDEKIDEAKMRAQVDYVIDGGLQGILAFGSNGEFYQIEEDEMERGFQIIVDQAAGRVPVYFGIGAINTKKCVRLAKMAVKNGAKGVSILQPMFLKPNFNELFLHFKTIAEAVPETPVLLYNNPGRVGYRRNRDVGFKVFGGKDTLLYASLCIGAVGGVCTAGNFMPELIVDIYNKYVAGDIKGALEAQYKLNPVRLAMDVASFPVAAKDMAAMRGRDVGSPYLPNLSTPEGVSYDKMKKEMEKAGLI